MPIFDQYLNSYEKLFGLNICFHDYSGHLKRFTGSERLSHNCSLCLAIKEDHQEICTRFDQSRLQQQLRLFPEGYFKICHGGITEVITPLRMGETVLGIMFFGQFCCNADGDFPDSVLRSKNFLLPTPITRKLYSSLLPLEKEKMPDWMAVAIVLKNQLERIIAVNPDFSQGDNSLRDQIETFIRSNLTRNIALSDLALHLSLSESRLGHRIKEIFTITYPELINRHRINHAKALLNYTYLPVVTIAERSGFNDPAYFHKVFKKLENITPNQYRKKFASENLIKI